MASNIVTQKSIASNIMKFLEFISMTKYTIFIYVYK